MIIREAVRAEVRAVLSLSVADSGGYSSVSILTAAIRRDGDSGDLREENFISNSKGRGRQEDQGQ